MTLTSRLAALEEELGMDKQSNPGSLEYHHPSGFDGNAVPSGLKPCDLRVDHGPLCVMSVTPTNTGVRFMRIIEGMMAE